MLFTSLKYNSDQKWFADLGRTKNYHTDIVNIEIRFPWQQQHRSVTRSLPGDPKLTMTSQFPKKI